MWNAFPTEPAATIAEFGSIPMVYLMFENRVKPSLVPKLREIVAGKHDKVIAKNAQGAAAYGRDKGAFFVTTMHEPNVDRRYGVSHWIDQPELTPELFNNTWRHVHRIYGEEGANENVMWVLEYWADNSPGDYYPGDEHVDWLALSAQNWWLHWGRHKTQPYRYLKDIISKNYELLSSVHKNKPIMLGEISCSKGADQAKWMVDAFATVKSTPRIKAVIVLDADGSGFHSSNENLGSTPETRKALREVFEDPYWILAR